MPDEFYAEDTSLAMTSDIAMLNILAKLSDREQDELVNWVTAERERAFVSGKNYQDNNATETTEEYLERVLDWAVPEIKDSLTQMRYDYMIDTLTAAFKSRNREMNNG